MMVYVIVSAVIIIICLGYYISSKFFPTDAEGFLNPFISLLFGYFLAVIVLIFAAAVIFFVIGCIKYAIYFINP